MKAIPDRETREGQNRDGMAGCVIAGCVIYYYIAVCMRQRGTFCGGVERGDMNTTVQIGSERGASAKYHYALYTSMLTKVGTCLRHAMCHASIGAI